MEDSTNGTQDDQHANQAKRTARIIEDQWYWICRLYEQA